MEITNFNYLKEKARMVKADKGCAAHKRKKLSKRGNEDVL